MHYVVYLQIHSSSQIKVFQESEGVIFHETLTRAQLEPVCELLSELQDLQDSCCHLADVTGTAAEELSESVNYSEHF